jgi:hypothetical protein
MVGKLFDFQKLGMVHDAHLPLPWAHFVTWGANVLIFQLYLLQETKKRYKTSLKKLTLVINIGYLDFDGPSELSQSVSRAKTHKTLKCTFWSKIGLFGGFGKYSGKSTSDFILFTGKAKVRLGTVSK